MRMLMLVWGGSWKEMEDGRDGRERKGKERKRKNKKTKRKGKERENPHQPLQRAKLHPFHPLPQSRYFLLDPRLRLFDLELLALGLLPDTALLEIEVKLDAGLSPTDLITQAGIEFCQIVGQSLVRGQRGRYVGGVEGQELGTKFGEVNFLRVVAAIGFW